MVSQVKQGQLRGNHQDPVPVDHVKRHARVRATAAQTLSEVPYSITSYREDKTFTLTESPDFSGTFCFQSLPARDPELGSFLNGNVAFDFYDITNLYQHLVLEFLNFGLLGCQEVVTRRAPLPPEVTARIRYLGNNARFRYCAACPVCRDFTG